MTTAKATATRIATQDRPARTAEVDGRDRVGVGADAEEGVLPEAEDPPVAPDEREAEGEYGKRDRRRQVDDGEELEDRRGDQHEQHADRSDGQRAPNVPGEDHRLFRKRPPVIPRGIRRRSTMAVTSRATSPMVGPVRNAAMPLTPAEQHRRGRGAGENRGSAGDDGDERLGDVHGADGRQHARDRREEPAREAADRGPDPERDHVDPRGGDAERGSHLRVLHGAPGDQPEARHLEHEEDRDAERHGDPDEQQLVGGRGVLADGDHPRGAERWWSRWRRRRSRSRSR